MKDEIQFFMPTRVFFGQDAVLNHAEALKGYGKKALIVTGKRSAKRNGAYDDMVKALERFEIESVLFDEIEENPSCETIDRATDFAKESHVEFIIGIGGGSPMDASKAIAVLVKNPSLKARMLFTNPGLKALPVIAVATTSGTGSETTQYAIMTDHIDQTKRNYGQSVFPEIAFLDPKYTYDMPIGITINTAVDAFSHLGEGYLSTRATVLSDGLAERGFELFASCVPALLSGTVSKETRGDLMLASTLGGMVIAQTGTSLPHGMGYALTYHKGIAHGMANGQLFSAFLSAFKDQTKVMRMLGKMGFDSIASFKQTFDQLMPTTLVLSASEMADYAKDMASNHAKLKNHPESVSESDILKIYQMSYGGY